MDKHDEWLMKNQTVELTNHEMTALCLTVCDFIKLVEGQKLSFDLANGISATFCVVSKCFDKIKDHEELRGQEVLSEFFASGIEKDNDGIFLSDKTRRKT